MEDLRVEADGLTDDRVPRLIILEELLGTSVLITIKMSELVLVGDAPSQLNVAVSHPDDADPEIISQLPEVLKKSPCASFMKSGGFSAAQIQAVILHPGRFYKIKHPIVVAVAIALRKEHEGSDLGLLVSMGRLNELAPLFGCEPPPMMVPPLGLAMALMERSEIDLQKLRKRIRTFPSKFGAASFSPKYMMVLMDPQDEEERGMAWRI